VFGWQFLRVEEYQERRLATTDYSISTLFPANVEAERSILGAICWITSPITRRRSICDRGFLSLDLAPRPDFIRACVVWRNVAADRHDSRLIEELIGTRICRDRRCWVTYRACWMALPDRPSIEPTSTICARQGAAARVEFMRRILRLRGCWPDQSDCGEEVLSDAELRSPAFGEAQLGAASWACRRLSAESVWGSGSPMLLLQAARPAQSGFTIGRRTYTGVYG